MPSLFARYYVCIVAVFFVAASAEDVNQCDATTPSTFDDHEIRTILDEHSELKRPSKVEEENDDCRRLASIPNYCMEHRIPMMWNCPWSCRDVAGVAIESFTREKLLKDAIQGYAYIQTSLPSEEDKLSSSNSAQEGCSDKNPECGAWANDSDDCMIDFDSMEETCAFSCHACFPPGITTIVDFGVPQVMEFDDVEFDEIAQVVWQTHKYMTERVLVQEKFEHLRRTCYNNDGNCSYYAAMGWCDSPEDIRWMQETCGPACGTCMAVEYWRYCGATPDMVDAFQPGDLGRMFESIISSRYAKNLITILSHPESKEDFVEAAGVTVLRREEVQNAIELDTDDEDDDEDDNDDEKPWILTLDNFLTDEECDFLIAQGEQLGYERSTYSPDLDDGGLEEDIHIVADGRTSKNTFCDGDCHSHSTTQSIYQRMIELTGLPMENAEQIQLLKYSENQFYDEHHDTTDHWPHAAYGNRILTIFLYLNDEMVGGETRFTKLGNLDVKPKRGMALVWPSVLDEDLGVKDDWTWHTATHVESGVKYAANVWWHLRDFANKSDLC